MKERLHKILAQAGVASRRECERLISRGSVVVNGQIVTELGFKVDPERDAIKVNRKRLSVKQLSQQASQYLILYKPKGVLTTMKPDPKGRATLLELLPGRLKTRVYPVGRLDFNSEGLVLLTNDGELAFRLTHPKFKLPKTYEVKVHGIPSEQILQRLSKGIILDEGKKTLPAGVRLLRKTRTNAWLLFTLHEGRKRQIRRMCESVRLPVSKLKRIAIGPITLKGITRGQHRFLLPEEIKKLKEAVKLS